VAKVQAGYKAQPLSAFPQAGRRRPLHPRSDFPKIDDAMLKANFFDYLDFVLAFGPPARKRRRFAPSSPASASVRQNVRFSRPVSRAQGCRAARDEGRRRGSRRRRSHFGTNINGWNVGFGPRGPVLLHGNWLLRAVGARAGIYGLDAVEATYPMTRVDAAGNRSTAASTRTHSLLRQASCRP